MSDATPNRAFTTELAGWAVRGILCAAPSAAFAVGFFIRRPEQWIAMIMGVAAWVLFFAMVCDRLSKSASPKLRKLPPVLVIACWLKIFGAYGGILAFSASALFDVFTDRKCWPLASVVGLEFVAGYLVMEFTHSLANALTLGGGADSEAPHWVLITTLLQGTVISGMLLILTPFAALLHRAWEMCRGLIIWQRRQSA
jgi:type IV secretory pathway TrbD component